MGTVGLCELDCDKLCHLHLWIGFGAKMRSSVAAMHAHRLVALD